MTTHDQLFYQEFLTPLYKKYEEDPRFVVSNEIGEKMWDVQYALLKEYQQDDLFAPVLWEEEDGRQLVVGFRVKGQPRYLLNDAQYSDKDSGALLMKIILDSAQFYQETGEKLSLISYIGFSDVYVEEV